MGSGENLFVGLDMAKLGYHCSGCFVSKHALHVILRRSHTALAHFCDCDRGSGPERRNNAFRTYTKDGLLDILT